MWHLEWVVQDDFIYGEYDDHHTYHPGDHEKGKCIFLGVSL